MRVEVYRNLHKNCWSIRDLSTGRVYQHAAQFVVRSSHNKPASFVVQPGGRERVVKEGRKNVHAFVRGTYGSPHFNGLDRERYSIKVSYNPYKAPHFVDSNNNKVAATDGLILLDTDGKAYIQNNNFEGME